ncbi:MAG: hypothetical protein KDB98_05835 [Flavobacteriales bacterium]|nr:hypothetical protein [Flavobacteriales bacterium]
MRQTLLCLMLGYLIVGCNQEDDRLCTEYWNLEKGQVSAFARVDSQQLVFEVWNPVTPNAIELNQTPLIGDFEVSLSVEQMLWDSLVIPQFRLEVYSEESVSGVSVNPSSFYCYVDGTEPENRDMRIMHDPTGTILITRTADTVRCSGDFGGVQMTYSNLFTSENLGVRLVFGSVELQPGLAAVYLSGFQALYDNPNPPSTPNSSRNFYEGVASEDRFDCQSW